jgi:hypothetical protein
MFSRSGRSEWAVVVALAAAALVCGASCRSASPLVGGDREAARGTISGGVAGPDGEAPVQDRLVEAVEVGTGDRHSATTSQTGGYTIEVPPGRYRIEVELAEGEALAESPEIVEVKAGQLVTGVDFVLGGAVLVR